MKRIIITLSVLGFLAVSYSAKGEHAPTTDTGAKAGHIVDTPAPAPSKEEKLLALVNACLVTRPTGSSSPKDKQFISRTPAVLDEEAETHDLNSTK